MRPTALAFSLLLAFPVVTIPQTIQRDPQAVTVLTQAITTMGVTVPSDSVATGTVTVIAGSTTDAGTVRILTRGTDQTLEEIQTSQPVHKVVYSRGQASEVDGTTAKLLNMELVVTSQSPDFPISFLACILNDSATSLQYVALEQINGVQWHHIRSWKSSADPRLQYLAEFSTKDIWIDRSSNLPRRISYVRREARGRVPRIFIRISFSDYRSTSGLFYPFVIEESLNGTSRKRITVQNVSFNTGLSDADFPIPAR